jgi:biopolymer transport protein ExbD
MIDVLVVIVFFLLTMFRAPSECGCGIPVDLPRAANTLDLVEAPVVVVRDTDVTVDAAPAGRAPASDGAEGIERIDELFIVLKSKRELWKSTHPSRAFAGAVLLAIDVRTPARVVKSVFQTVACAGYPSVSFMVDTPNG